MSTLQLNAQPRTLIGRRVRQLRVQGLVPVIVYGNRQEPANLQVAIRDLELTLHSGGSSQLVELAVQDGRRYNVLVRQVQRHPVTHNLMHADFYAVNMREKQQVQVPVHAVGKPTALAAGLMLLQSLDHVEIEALPADIPAHVDVDVTELSPDHPITIANLPSLASVRYLGHAEEIVFTMIVTRGAEAEEEAAVAEEMVEPEVLSRGKQEEGEVE